MKKYSKQISHYISLIGLLAVGLVGFIVFWFDKSFQLALIISLGFGYFVWAMVHHLVHKDLTVAVIIEYLAFSVLGVLLAMSAMRFI